MQASVIGVPDATFGEVPVAIVRDTPQTQNSETIEKIVTRELGLDYALGDVKTLSDIQMKEFPLNQTGKVMKVTLKEAYLKLRDR